jgi:Uma2 family endonuclease
MLARVHTASFESCEPFTQPEFAAWMAKRASRDAERCELLNGRIVMNPPVGWPHGEGEVRISTRLDHYSAARRAGRVFGSSQGFELPSGDTVAPDVSFVSEAHWRAAKPQPGKFLTVVPDLVVEILSPSTASRDRGEKRAIYERNGVREYWVVDLAAQKVTRFTLVDDRYDAGVVFAAHETLQSVVLEGLSIPVAELIPQP